MKNRKRWSSDQFGGHSSPRPDFPFARATRAVVPLGDGALERAVVQRVILDHDRQALITISGKRLL
jgi:hypothetical protein